MLFDDQAGAFDQRAGLPGEVPARVAREVAAMAALAGAGGTGGILDMGAGTGEIGIHLAGLSRNYVALDLSLPMLRSFRERPGFAAGKHGLLAQADGDAPWPLAAGTVEILFGSRSLHFIRPAHLAAEARRLAGDHGLVFLLGKVERDPDSVKESMRRKMRKLLEEKGYSGRGGRKGREALWTELGDRGAVRLEPRLVAKWPTASSAWQSLRSWDGKAGLAGLTVPETTKREVLDALRDWARERFGSLDREIASEEAYVLEGMAYR